MHSSSSSPTCPDPTLRLSRHSSERRNCATPRPHPLSTDTFTSVQPRTIIPSSTCRSPPSTVDRPTPFLVPAKAGGLLKSRQQERKTSSSLSGHCPSRCTTIGGAKACQNCRSPACIRFDSISLLRVQISSTPRASLSPAPPSVPPAPSDSSSVGYNHGQDSNPP
jgi:hypothetical protein